MPMSPLRLALGALLLSLAAPCLAQSKSPARTIIVMDGSGSMWGQIDGRPKLEIARETVAQVLSSLPESRALGLVAYGHRRRGDCSDIEIMVPPGAGTASAISEAVNAMRFQGKTPLSDAVRQAAEALRFTEEPATVVLITDGLETCAADPCALGRDLESAGIDFTAHVVGFGLSRKEGAEVACLAEETGGRYLRAGDQKDLTQALTETITEVAEIVPEPEPEAAPAAVQPQARLTAPHSATIVSPIEIVWEGPEHEEDYIDIAPASPIGAKEMNWTRLDEGSPLMLKAPAEPGDYVIRYISPKAPEQIVASRPITILEGDVVLDGPQRAEVGSAISVTWRGPGGSQDYIDIVPESFEATSNELSYAYTSDGNPALFLAPIDPGRFQIRYIVQGEGGERSIGLSVPIEITPSSALIDAPEAVQPGTSFPARAIGPQSPGHWLDLTHAGHQSFSGELSYFYLNHMTEQVSENTLTAPSEPGTYDLRYVIEGKNGTRRVIARRSIDVRADAPADPALGPLEDLLPSQ